MEQIIKDSILKVDQLIDDKEYSDAFSILCDLSEQYPNEGIIPYYLGRVCLNVNEEHLALQYFLASMKRNYKSSDLFLMTGILLSDEGEELAAEESLINAEKTSKSDEERWVALSSLAVLYIEYERYLKAQRIIKQLIREYPNNYQGYHLYIVEKVATEQFDEANAFILQIPQLFSNHPQFLLDYIELLQVQNKDDELNSLLNTDSRFAEIIPQEVLRARLNIIAEKDSYDKKKDIIIELAKKFNDCDAIISLMIIAFAEGDFKKSSKIAALILEKEKATQGIRFYWALYFQIFNYYFLSDKRPSEQLAIWIHKAGNWCVSYAESFNSDEIGTTIRVSIQALFDEISQTFG